MADTSAAELAHAVGSAADVHRLEKRVRALTEVLVSREVDAGLIVQSALALFGASAVIVARTADKTGGGEGEGLVVDGSAGIPDAGVQAGRTIPPSAADPLALTARTGQPLEWFGRERILGCFPGLALPGAATDVHTLAVVPATHLGVVQGVLAVVLPMTQPFASTDRALLEALGARYARMLRLEHVHASMWDARARADLERARTESAVAELAQARDELKIRVRNRTAEIARANVELAAALAERKRDDEERRLLRLQLASAEENERRRIARELHDQLGQHLTAMRLGIDEIGRLLGTPERARERLAALQSLAGAMSHDVRHLALDLRPPELDDVGLESALETYVNEWAKRYRISAEIAISRRQTAVPPDVGTALYRIAQEALTNVVKHAAASTVGIVVEHTDLDVRLIIEDDGHGFDAADTEQRVRRERRLGLAGMRERATVVGGTLTVESSLGHGTTVYVCLPLSVGATGTERSAGH